MTKRFGLSAGAIKYLMAALMLLDHIYHFLPGRPVWFTWLGRIVAPTFCYLMTQSLRHTRDRAAFLRRMTLAGLLMLAGSLILQILVHGFTRAGILGGPAFRNMIFLSLAASGAIVDQIEGIAKEGIRFGRVLTLAACSAAATLFLEGSALIPLIAIIFYFLDDRKLLMCVTYIAAASLVVLLWKGMPLRQLFQAFAVVPILLYDGTPGARNAFSKWFFYLFYPIHIWVLYLIAAG